MTISSDAIIVSIHISAAGGMRGAPLTAVALAELVQGQGVVGDKRFSLTTKAKNQLTLIEEEALQAAMSSAGLAPEPSVSRRNVVTRGVALNHLVGQRFVIGTAVVQGIELCEPCGHLAKLTTPAFGKALVHRGGLRCEILHSGLCRIGDAVRRAHP